jgi:hypothetical protein
MNERLIHPAVYFSWTVASDELFVRLLCSPSRHTRRQSPWQTKETYGLQVQARSRVSMVGKSRRSLTETGHKLFLVFRCDIDAQGWTAQTLSMRQKHFYIKMVL